MRVHYDPNLIEHTSFQVAHRDSSLESEVHRATDPLYDMTDEREKNVRFHEIYKTFFQRLKLDASVPQLLAEYALVEEAVRQCIVREAANSKQEKAELYVKQSDDGVESWIPTIFIHARPCSLLDATKFASRMRHEIRQVADMLDDSFGYRKESLMGRLPQQNLIRDRYRVLWDIYTEGRLARDGHQDEDAHRWLRPPLERVFSTYSPAQLSLALERVFQATSLTHNQLLEWASSPLQLFEGKSMRPSHGQFGDSGACPVCGFLTFDWLDLEGDIGVLRVAVQKDIPDWRPEKGICRQCAEIYTGSNGGERTKDCSGK